MYRLLWVKQNLVIQELAISRVSRQQCRFDHRLRSAFGATFSYWYVRGAILLLILINTNNVHRGKLRIHFLEKKPCCHNVLAKWDMKFRIVTY